MAHIREYDGVRGVDIEVSKMAPDLIFLEAGGHCYAFDRALFLHGFKKALGIAFVVEEMPTVKLV